MSRWSLVTVLSCAGTGLGSVLPGDTCSSTLDAPHFCRGELVPPQHRAAALAPSLPQAGAPGSNPPHGSFFLVFGGSTSSRMSPPPLGHLLLNPPALGCCRILCQAGISVRNGALHQCQRGPWQPPAAAPPCMPNAGLRHLLTGHSHRNYLGAYV